MKTPLFIGLFLSTAIIAGAQDLTGKLVYSHHNGFVSSNADSIFSLNRSGTKTFITLGFDPMVSASGTYMAFENGPSYSALHANVWIRNLSTKKDAQIINNPVDYLNYFDFRPGNQQIVYAQSCNIYTSNIDGSNAYTFLVCTPCDCYSDDPQIRLSDGLIVYHNLHWGIYTCNADGSNPQKLSATIPGDMYPTWSTNGKWIAFLKTSQHNAIYKIKPNGTDTVCLTFFAAKDSIAFNPVWSKDGAVVYFVARIKGKLGLYQVSADGSGTYSLVYKFEPAGSITDYFLGTNHSVNFNLPLAVNNTAVTENISLENNPGFTIYPNPSSGSFTLATTAISKKAEVIITDAEGKKVYQRIFNNTSSAYIQLHQPGGMYFVTVRTGSSILKQPLIIE